MLTYCHVGIGLDVANIAINLARRFNFNFTLTGFLPKKNQQFLPPMPFQHSTTVNIV